MKVDSKVKKCTTKCEIHRFLLKPMRPDLYYKKQTTACFCNKKPRQPEAIEQVYPKFNFDCRHYTPAFVLEVDKQYYKDNDLKMYREHEQKVQEYTVAANEILQPKPCRKHKYCAVCKNNYQDYLEHIKSAGHKNIVRVSKHNDYILDVCRTSFGNNERNLDMSMKLTVSQPFDCELRPTKKIKSESLQKVPENLTTATKTHHPINNNLIGYEPIYQLNQRNLNLFMNSIQPPMVSYSQQFPIPLLTHFCYDLQLGRAPSLYNCLPGIAEKPIVISGDDQFS